MKPNAKAAYLACAESEKQAELLHHLKIQSQIIASFTKERDERIAKEIKAVTLRKKIFTIKPK